MSSLLPPDESQQRACLRCEWWKPLNSVAGKCKRNAPVNIDVNGYGYWPVTGRSDWCGGFAASRQREELP